jgi:hypothetical protein
MGKLTDAQRHILAFIADQPSGSCRVNWLPTDIDFRAYRELRQEELLFETGGRGGWLEVSITPAGRTAIQNETDQRATRRRAWLS